MPIRKTKNWDAVGHLFTAKVPAELQVAAREVLLENARIYKEELVDMIEYQDGDWKPLDEKWVDRKARDGYETDTYRQTDEFLEYLKSDRSQRYVKGQFAGGKIFVGARSDIRHGNISMELLAWVLDHDYNRPLFEPAYDRARPLIEANWKKIFARMEEL